MTRHLVCAPVKTIQVTPRKPIITDRALCLSTIYLAIPEYPFWVDQEGPTQKGWTIIRHLKESKRHGLLPGKYELDTIQELLPSQDPENLARLETLLTFGLVRYIYDIYGQPEPLPGTLSNVNTPADDEEPSPFDPVEVVRICLETKDLHSYLTDLTPNHYHYTSLQEALAHYESIAAAGGWLSIPEGPVLKPGMNDPRIKAVKLRLMRTDRNAPGLLKEVTSVFDDQLRREVVAFQNRHNLVPDGIIGNQTLKAMNVPVRDRIDTIRANMTRWHRHDRNLGKRYILVNIADSSLKGVDNESTLLDIPVIVGTRQNQTPVFSDRVKYLVFNPYWTVTPGIARREQLPALRKNPFHLVEKNIRLFSGWQEDSVELDSTLIDWDQITPAQMNRYRLRQDPGPWNSLGKLKFIFPNRYSVYMHDTPAQDLFSRQGRYFSHGCIRVSDPPALASFIFDMQGDGFDHDRLVELYNQEERIAVPLRIPVPVHITYQTCWVDKEGTIHFNSDVYARDSRLLQAKI